MLPNSKCTGCLACVSACNLHCITPLEDKDGFVYPHISEKQCTHCLKCEKICPVLNKSENCSDSEELPEAYAAYTKNEEIRKQSSSGGVFSVLAEYVLAHHGIVYGAAFGEKLTVSHIGVEKAEDLSQLRGSKYVQSNIAECYGDIEKKLKADREVLFSGTPCQVEGLKAFLGRNYRNLISVDIICHGVPSPRVWREYLKWQEKHQKSEAVQANFRDKVSGWETFSLSVTFENGHVNSEKLDEDFYMKAFLHNLCLRNSCYQCSFKTSQHVSDLTIGDLWGIKEIASELNDNKGTSLVLVQSVTGKRVLEAISNEINIYRVDSKMAIEHNSAMTRSVYKQPLRDYFYQKLGKMEFDQLVNESLQPGLRTRVERKLLQLTSK